MKFTDPELKAMFGPALREVSVTIDEVVDEIERELLMRFSVYPDWVRNHRIGLPLANKRASCLLAALRLLRQSPGVDNKQTKLFDDANT